MNQSHYPSLELCKQLTEAGFIGHARSQVLGTDLYVCPSIAELLDELPKCIDTKKCYKLMINYTIFGVEVMYANGDGMVEGEIFSGNTDELPNALSEMYIWCKQNNHLPK